MYVRARAHWPNVAQIDLTVVVVIVGVVVAVIVDMLRRYFCFLKSVTDRHTDTHTDRQTGVVIELFLKIFIQREGKQL